MSNPYELRFSMLMEAKTFLIEEYHAKLQQMNEKYHAEKDAGESPVFPTQPNFPSFEDIAELCNKMNSFVSNK
jgi:hypothetical protein